MFWSTISLLGFLATCNFVRAIPISNIPQLYFVLLPNVADEEGYISSFA